MKSTLEQQCLSYTVNTMPADTWATLGASASAGMVLTPKAEGNFRSQCISRHGIDPQSWNISSSASEELMHFGHQASWIRLGVFYIFSFRLTTEFWTPLLWLVARFVVTWPRIRFSPRVTRWRWNSSLTAPLLLVVSLHHIIPTRHPVSGWRYNWMPL